MLIIDLKMYKIPCFALFLIVFSSNLYANDIYNKYNQIQGKNSKYQAVTPWNESKGLTLLEQAEYKKDFYNLAHHYQPQQNPLYCGIATIAIILNALNLEHNLTYNSVNHVVNPINNQVINFNIYTQDDILNEKTNLIKHSEVINFKAKDNNAYDPGLTLAQLRDIFKSYKLKVKLTYADQGEQKGVKNFRKYLRKNLNKKDHYIIANFHGKTFGAQTGGHISPVVAYNEMADMILILDVAAHKNPWYWVKLENFYDAMHHKDGTKHRGFLIVKK